MKNMTTEEFRQIREMLDVPPVILALALETTQPTVSRYESGKRKIPGPVRKLMRLFRKQPELMEDEE